MDATALMSDFASMLDELAKKGFGITRTEAHHKCICIMCRKPPKLPTPSDRAEYHASALCPECFRTITENAEGWDA